MDLRVGTSDVRVDIYRPADSLQHPLIVMLHGMAGVFTNPPNQMPMEDNFGEKQLAESCFAVALPHYFDLLHVKALLSREELQSRFAFLLAGLGGLLMQLEALPGINPSAIGLYGESYGGFLAVALATRDSLVKAVSEYSAGNRPAICSSGKRHRS